jgi:hypothetical protein
MMISVDHKGSLMVVAERRNYWRGDAIGRTLDYDKKR